MSTDTKPAEKKQPWGVYDIREPSKRGGKDYWHRVGSAFPHDDGVGFNVLLDSLPFSLLQGGEKKLVIRPLFKDDDAPPPTQG
jgi:hypothetical protein